MYRPPSHPLGRHHITGTIIAIHIAKKGYREITILHRDGWDVTGALPHRAGAVDIGQTITLTATLTDGYDCDVQHGRFRWAQRIKIQSEA